MQHVFGLCLFFGTDLLDAAGPTATIFNYIVTQHHLLLIASLDCSAVIGTRRVPAPWLS